MTAISRCDWLVTGADVIEDDIIASARAGARGYTKTRNAELQIDTRELEGLLCIASLQSACRIPCFMHCKVRAQVPAESNITSVSQIEASLIHSGAIWLLRARNDMAMAYPQEKAIKQAVMGYFPHLAARRT